jgi:CHAT domain-containing protein/tetratricopeptide (TPR) repeat protein
MPDAQKLAALMAEYQSLDRSRDAPRMRQILEQAIPEIDRTAAPKKWAAFHGILGMLREGIDPRGALEAYRKALEVWTPEQDRDSWVTCHSGAGMSLFALQPLLPEEADEAIAHLEAAEPDQPFLARPLALLYQLRQNGDPWENWRNRIKQLELAQAQIRREQEPVKWANAENELAVATGEEPDGNYPALMARRRERHLAALDALGDDRGAEYIETCMHLSEIYLFGVLDDTAASHRKAEEFARRAVEAAQSQPSAVLRASAKLALGRTLATGQHAGRKQDLLEALKYFDEAIAAFHEANRPELEGNAMSLRANTRARLIRLGDKAWIEPMVEDAEQALRRLDPQFYHGYGRPILQMLGEALLDADQPERAAGGFERAVAAAREGLAHATTPQGRMERIWEFRDSSALLSFCYLRIGREEDALQALEDGKGRYWIAADSHENREGVDKWIPRGGALLFANFARDPGAVIVIAASGSKVVWLPGFGRSRLMELQRGGAEPAELGGWLKDYYFRNSQPANWRSAIDSIGEALYKEIWAPVIDALPALDVREGAELVWFPQGGSGVFPMHAAWRSEGETRKWLLDAYAIRYAPSTRALAAVAKRTSRPEKNVLVIDPLGDLVYARLEGAWVLQQTDAAQTQVLQGPAATKAAVLAAWGGASRIHLATHAVFDLERPLESHLMMAGPEKLTINELLPHLASNAPEMVVLSACETAMSRVATTPDEFLGFPAAFLHAGAATVIATLWPVDDKASALLMGKFYIERRSPDTSSAEALRRAQMWLRTVKARDVIKLLGELRDQPDPVGGLASQWRVQLRAADPEQRPFAEPDFWAAFTVAGY